MIFKASGIDAQSSGSGAAARALLAEGRFDVIVSDVRMPDGDGVELLARLRASGDRTPFVFMTGYATIDAAQAKALGAAGFLRKPFEMSDFLSTVRAAVGR
jgi:DNA-binding NtrC family response regulator